MVLFYCGCLMLVSGLYVFWFVCLVAIVLVDLIWLVAFGWVGCVGFWGLLCGLLCLFEGSWLLVVSRLIVFVCFDY